MIKVLANDGISQSGITALEKAGFEVITGNVNQDKLINYINENNISVLLVRSATTARKDLIDSCPNLKIIGRGGVGMDNIDVDYARSKNIEVINTPAASSASVAELVFAHLFNMVRFVYDSNRQMPLEGDTKFKDLKKAYAKGKELKGKKLGVIGFGRIGQEVAKRAIGLGMEVIACDKFIKEADVELSYYDNQKMNFKVQTTSLDEVLEKSDFITLHVPLIGDKAVIGKAEIDKMKDGVGIVNAARGGVIDEVALVSALTSGKITSAGLDVFENEPNPDIHLLMQPNISLTPHIGAATLEAQDRIGTELAEKISASLS
jgi:D-3-phosphoglycerate dehydrogenase / 2-oxoglutarate reductase